MMKARGVLLFLILFIFLNFNFLEGSPKEIPLDLIQKNDFQAVKKMIADGFDVNSVYKEGWTPLMIAAVFNSSDVARLLIEAGAKVDIFNECNALAFFKGKEFSTLETGRMLRKKIEAGEYSIIAEKKQNETWHHVSFGVNALMLATENSSIDVMKVLIEAKADVNKIDMHDVTVLMRSAATNSLDTARLLIENGADINKRTLFGHAALMIATSCNSTEVAEYLINKGADINAEDSTGFTALIGAVENNSLSMTKLLVDKGVNVNKKVKKKLDAQGNLYSVTPLMIAVDNNCLAIVKLLVDKGANVEERNEIGESALDIAQQCGYEEIEKLLIEKIRGNKSHAEK